VAELLLAFVALWPICTAALWIAGGLLYWLFDQRKLQVPEGGWPGVTVLIPAYNEEAVIANSVTAALAADYPELEVLVLDDGSPDETSAAALAAAGDDPRCEVIRDDVNRGKADRLNDGFRRARHELVVVTDADTHMHPQAIKRLVARMLASPIVAAVGGAPRVTNRRTFLAAMQIIEAASIIGLIRRTQALTGRVGVIAGVLALFRRDRVLAVGGFDPRMATEDIDVTWKLLLAGWQTTYAPRALVGMEVPTTLRGLWAQRKRWARGQGEVIHVHLRQVLRWRNRRMWLLAVEGLASLLWVTLLAVALVLALVEGLIPGASTVFGLALGWGIAIAVVAMVQAIFALILEFNSDPRGLRALLLNPLYPLWFWTVSALAALRCEVLALLRGPAEARVVWDIPREGVGQAGDGSR
jgi:biofilm PGA synthesis N-glycosyltransferase PgaC